MRRQKARGQRKGADTRQKIYDLLFYSSRPLRLHELSKELGLDRQLVRYHLNMLRKEGTVIPLKFDGVTHYSLQTFLYQEKELQDFIQKMGEILGWMDGRIVTELADVDEDIIKMRIIVRFLLAVEKEAPSR